MARSAAPMNDPKPPHQGGLAVGPLDARRDDEFVGLVHNLPVERPLAGEIVVDRGPGQIGADGDRLESRPVISPLTENQTSGVHYAFSGLVGLRRGGAPWSTTRC